MTEIEALRFVEETVYPFLVDLARDPESGLLPSAEEIVVAAIDALRSIPAHVIQALPSGVRAQVNGTMHQSAPRGTLDEKSRARSNVISVHTCVHREILAHEAEREAN